MATGNMRTRPSTRVWETHSYSVAGRRERNEDRVLVLPLPGGAYFLAVADGMGGIRGGEIASAAVLDAAREFLLRRFAAAVRSIQLKKITRELFAFADDAVRSKQAENPQLAGMGTTLACLLAQGSRYVVGNIGDSRIYRLRGGRLTQITTDHTYVQEMITKTGTKPDPGIVRKFGHVVTRSIEGSKEKPDLFPVGAKFFTLADGDGFLLCSDGLIIDKSLDHASALELHFKKSTALKESAARMVAFALEAGSSDNISVVLARWDRLAPAAENEHTTHNALIRPSG